MSLSVTIHPLSCDLDMFGEPDSSSAYSLSGHIALSVTSPFSLFESRRTARLLLQSVSLTFEGQSEIFTPSTGYSAVRLCSITRELAPSEHIELSNEGHEDSKEPCVWNIIFNLPIPGWLPASVTLGMEDIGIRYGLYVKAKFTNLDEDLTSWSFASLCAPFRSRVRTVEANQDINVRRFFSPPSPDSMIESSTLNYLVNTQAPSNLDNTKIPADVLSKIQVLASVPQCANIDGSMLPVTLRLRTKNLAEEECKRIQVTDVAIDVVQQEKCRHQPSAAYLARYPVPAREMQPPNLPLRDPHHLSSIYDVGLYVPMDYVESISRSFSLLPSTDAGKHSLALPNYAFANDASDAASDAPTWYTMETTVPFLQKSKIALDADCIEWAGPANIRASMTTPLYSVQHEIIVALTCSYDLADGQVAKDRLTFRLPVKFGKHVARPNPSGGATLVASQSSTAEGSVPSLPIYSELYDSNGERKIDHDTPLPLYSPRPELDASTPSIDQSSPQVHPIQDPAFPTTYHNAHNDVKPSPLLIPDVDSSTSA